MVRGGSAGIEDLDRVARRVYEIARWHVELYADAKDLEPVAKEIARLPAVSIAHLGLSPEGLPTLVRLAERGMRVKATGFGRATLDVPSAIRALVKANPDALMFGSDLPSTRAPRPFLDSDIALIVEALGEEGARRALWDNARAFYGKSQ
jgi:predicted TIM-barrel fold metal-dependent hydrolase